MTGIDLKEAITLLKTEGTDTYELFSRANTVRLKNRGLDVNLCSIVNARSGACSQDCKFCAQSKHNNASISEYPLIEPGEIADAADRAQAVGAVRFGIVTSGFAVNESVGIEKIASAIKEITLRGSISPCASLGKVNSETLSRLKDSGLARYHCNIETAKSHFKDICTTRSWQAAVDTVEAAKKLGLKTCSGGIIGMGESLEQRVEFLDQIRQMDVDSVPLNFLNPIKGTKLTHLPPLQPLECLKVVAVAGLMMPDKEIRVCGGREHNLGDLQSWLLICGADSLMVGGYLTTAGRNVEDDIRMITEAGFTVASITPMTVIQSDDNCRS